MGNQIFKKMDKQTETRVNSGLWGLGFPAFLEGGCPNSKDYSILGSKLGSPHLGNLPNHELSSLKLCGKAFRMNHCMHEANYLGNGHLSK